MNAKDHFKALKHLENQIESKRYMAKTYRTLAEGVGSPIYSDMPKSTSRQLEPMAEALIKAVELEDEANWLEHQLVMKRAQTMDGIMQLDREHQIILIQRYFENQAWWEIEKSMHYSRSWIYKLHTQALDSFERYLKRLE